LVEAESYAGKRHRPLHEGTRIHFPTFEIGSLLF
jgi:hypothetical protein